MMVHFKLSDKNLCFKEGYGHYTYFVVSVTILFVQELSFMNYFMLKVFFVIYVHHE